MVFVAPPYEVAIIGNKYNNKRQKIDKDYFPNVLFSDGQKEGKLA